MKSINEIPGLASSSSKNFVLIAGPCVIENDEIPLQIAERLVEVTTSLDVPLVFKASYRKANRSRIDSFTGIGDLKALKVLEQISEKYKIPVLTDVHSDSEAVMVADYVDVIQIPAFLCRQTSLLQAAGRTGKWVNIKKGQFVGPEAMKWAVEKVIHSGGEKVMITERGTTFGYRDLVVDFRGFPTMRNIAPLVFDATHSLQQPNHSSGVTGGRPELIATMINAAVGAGIDALFIETHPQPQKALSDGANMLPLQQLPSILEKAISIHQASR